MSAALSRGGHLVAMASWTVDSGSGAEMTISSSSLPEGEVVVYSGTDPTSLTDFKFIGTYFGTPIGKKCFTKYGGDLLALFTQTGLYPFQKLF